MRRRPTVEEIITSLLNDEGFYEIYRSSESTCVDSMIVLSNGEKEIAVNILNDESCNSKSTIQEALIETQRLQNKYDGVILAFPRRYSKVIDESLLLKYGIGLIIYDTMGAEEIMPPRLNHSRREKERIENTHNDTRDFSTNEVALLRSEISRILRILEEMEARLDRLEKEQRILSFKISELEKENSSITKEQKVIPQNSSRFQGDRSQENLPSYLRDNPWIDILSKKV